MKSAVSVIQWLRGLHRGFKLAILLVAAWAPFIFSGKPLLGCVLMILTTAIFFMATGRPPTDATPAPDVACEKADVEP
jgi:hypothetical protein